MFRLDNKVAIVTGGASGIGEQIVRAFIEQGATAVIADMNEAAGGALAAELGPTAFAGKLDITDPAAVQAFVQLVAERHGRVDIFVNNAGIPLVGNVEETTPEDFIRVHNVNVNGVFYGCKYAVEQMLKQGGGTIVNIASVAGLVAVERRFAYCSTKGAVVAMTRQLAIDYALKGIRVNAVAPGTVYTPFVDRYLKENHSHELEETKAKLHARQPIGRMATPDEIAKAVVYLSSDEASFATGSILTIDGGWTAK